MVVFVYNFGMIVKLYLKIIDCIMVLKCLVNFDGIFLLFIWMNDGGLVMDKMIVMILDFLLKDECIVIGIVLFDEIVVVFCVMKIYFFCKMVVVECEGSLGWIDKCGVFVFWLFFGFIVEYVVY